MKKYLIFFLTIFLTFSLFSACKSEKTSPETTTAGSTTASSADETSEPASEEGGSAYKLPIGDGVNDTLSFACLEGWYSAVSMNDNLEIWQAIEDITGIKIEWEANGDYDTAMTPRIASGQELPDIFMIPPTWGNSGVYKLASDGILTQLDDLIAQYAPDITQLLNEDAELKGMLTAPDGNIYTVADTPKYVNELVAQYALLIRQDWIDTLSLPQPETIEDWYNVLISFKNDDPNGNGANDEIPFSGIGDDYGYLTAFKSAFGLPVGVEAWWYDENGKVLCTYTTEEYRSFLTEMHKWYEEGLLDMEMNRDEANFQSLCSTNIAGAFSNLSERQTQYDNLLNTSGFPEARHTILANPKDDEGDLIILKRSPTWSHYAIPTSSTKAELAIKWINFVWGSDEGVTFTEWGIEGKTYTVENGKKQYTDFVLNNPDGLDPYNALRSLGASNTILVRTPSEVYAALNSESDAISYGESIIEYRREPFPGVMSTDEEQDILDVYEPDFNTYCSESIVKFITGEQSMDTFDDFVSTLNSIGLDKLLEVKQAQFDRSGMK